MICKCCLYCKLFGFSAFQRIGTAISCAGKQRKEGYKAGLDACAQACKGKKAELFSYGTNEYREPRCKERKCACLCHLETENARCKEEKIHYGYGYDLYAFDGEITNRTIFPFYSSHLMNVTPLQCHVIKGHVSFLSLNQI